MSAEPAATENASAPMPSITPELPGVGMNDTPKTANTFKDIIESAKPSTGQENAFIIKYGIEKVSADSQKQTISKAMNFTGLFAI